MIQAFEFINNLYIFQHPIILRKTHTQTRAQKPNKHKPKNY